MKYSDRLGEISDEQIQKALDVHSLGKLIKSAPTQDGLFGQNIFITTDKGEYVLRGKPHYDWQFPTEKFFAEQLHEHTNAPVPYPYIYDPNTSIFGWEYILMPRLPGFTLKDKPSKDKVSDSDRIEIANLQGELLAEVQNLTFETIGKYDMEKKKIVSPQKTYAKWMETYIEEDLKKAAGYNDLTTDKDREWVHQVLASKRKYMERHFTPSFVMQDYKPGNMNVQKTESGWEISGLFDLMECYSGNGESDLARMFCVYVGGERKDLAHNFVSSYIKHSNHQDVNGLIERFPVYTLRNEAIIWEWKQRPGKELFKGGISFRKWASPYMELDSSMLDV